MPNAKNAKIFQRKSTPGRRMGKKLNKMKNRKNFQFIHIIIIFMVFMRMCA